MISSQGAGVPSSSSNSRVSLGTTVTSASEEPPHHRPPQSYRKQHQERRNSNYTDYHHEPHSRHNNKGSQFHQHHLSRNKKSYPENSSYQQHLDSGAYHQYYHGADEKENFPSPPPAYSYDEYQQYRQASTYDRSSYALQQGSHASSYQNQCPPPYYEEEWRMHHEGYYYYHQGPPDISYQKSANGIANASAYHEGDGFYPSSGGSDANGLSFVDHTYRDFSGVPPTEEDRERYNNKKQEYNRRVKEQKNASKAANKETDHSRALKKKRGRGNRATKGGSTGFIGFMGTNFPARLHDLLSHEEEISSIITWLPHGRSWIVLDKNEFLNKVAPSHFQISKFESFTRQVNGWGFKRITQGPDINSYYHELFLKGMPHLIQWMKRSTSSGPGRRKIRADPKDEPDFYSISQMYPIPDYYGEHRPLQKDYVHSSENGSTSMKKQKKENDELLRQSLPSPNIRPSKRSRAEKDNSKKIIPLSSSSFQSHEENEMPKLSNCTSSGTQFDRDPNGAHYYYSGGPYQGIEHSTDGATYANPPPVDSPHHLHSNDVTQVKNFWTGDSYNNTDFVQHQRRHHENYNNHHHENNYNDHSDFKPLEGSMSYRENHYDWDDAAYVRQHYDSNNRSEQTQKDNDNDSSTQYNRSVKFLDNGEAGQQDRYPSSCSAIVSTDDTNDDSFPACNNSTSVNSSVKKTTNGTVNGSNSVVVGNDAAKPETQKDEGNIISKDGAADGERSNTKVARDSSCATSALTKKLPSTSTNDKDLYDGSIRDIMSIL